MAAHHVACCACLIVCLGAPAQSLSAARSEARLGKVDAAVAALKQVPGSADKSALLCELYASIDQRDAAATACEAAATAAPADSQAALQLARAYGAKADASGALTGMKLVGKIRGGFERAVQLDPNNVEALSDLGEFYVEAPGVVGGGLDKARALVPRLQPLSAARAHRLAGMIAAKQKEDTLAEQEYRAELSVAHSPEAYVDLANFFRSRKQWDKSAESARAALDRDTQHGPDTLDAARILIELKRDAPTAQAALRSYLKIPQPNVASYARAEVLLGNSLRDTGDTAGAKAAFEAALALARDYAPARQGLAR